MDARPHGRRALPVPTEVTALRIVKKTLKGDLNGRTGFKKVQGGKARDERAPATPESQVAAASTGSPLENGEIAGAPDVVERPVPRAAPLPTRLKPRTQASLDALVKGDDLVVITETLHPRHGRAIVPTKAAHETEKLGRTDLLARQEKPEKNLKPAAPAKPDVSHAPLPPDLITEGTVPLTRSVLAHALYRDFGEPGSQMEHKGGTMFHIHSKWADGAVRTRHPFLLPLPAGAMVPHEAELHIELENKAMLGIDIVTSSVTIPEMKALAYDSLQMRRLDRAFSVLVFVRTPGGMTQAQAESIGHGYDFHFGIDEAHVHQPERFSALRARIHTWVQAASGRPAAK